MSRANHTRDVQAKMARQGVTEQHPVGRKNKRPRPWVVWIQFQFTRRWLGEWRVMGRYRSESEAKQAADNAARKFNVALRIEGPSEEAQP